MNVSYQLEPANRPFCPTCVPGNIVISDWNGKRVICLDDDCKNHKDPKVKFLFETVKKIFEFFLIHFDFPGINGKGEIPPLYLNWDQYNAAWTCGMNGENCGFIFNNHYANISEVVAHEWVHGIVHRVTNLSQSQKINDGINFKGALNEGLADVLGIAFKHWDAYEKQIRSDWNITGLRDLSLSFTTANLKSSRDGAEDNGHVHHNSQIISHAFYLATTTLQTDSWGIIAHIWFKALQDITSPTETFYDFALKTIKHAENNAVKNVLIKAWQKVGIISVEPIRMINQQQNNQSSFRYSF